MECYVNERRPAIPNSANTFIPLGTHFTFVPAQPILSHPLSPNHIKKYNATAQRDDVKHL